MKATALVVALVAYLALVVVFAEPDLNEHKTTTTIGREQREHSQSVDTFEAKPALRGQNHQWAQNYQHEKLPLWPRELQGVDTRLDLVEICLQTFSLQDFLAYLSFSFLANDISQTGKLFTIFPPYDNAFDLLAEQEPILLSKLKSLFWYPHVQNWLRYHFVEGDFPPSTVVATNATRTLTMMNGERVTLTRAPLFRVNGVRVLAPYNATNGQAYMLDNILRPEWMRNSLLNVVLDKFSTLATVVEAAGLQNVFADPAGAYTLLAPNNQAFIELGSGATAYLLSDEGIPLLQDILRYHVIMGGPFPDILIQSPRMYQTLFGTETVQIAPGRPNIATGKINQAGVVAFDILANNGVIHEIDTVLLFESIPTRAPTSMPTAEPQPTQAPEPAEWRIVGGPFASPTDDIELGAGVSMAGNFAAVGAPGILSPNTGRRVGGIQMFRKLNGEWNPFGQILSQSMLREFGSTVDLSFSSSTQFYGLLSGAPQSLRSGLTVGGARYYEFSGSGWNTVGQLLFPPSSPFSLNSDYGAAVSASVATRRLAIGAPRYDVSATAQDNGCVFTYEFGTNIFVNFSPDLCGPSPGDRYGAAVSLAPDGNVLAIGAPGPSGALNGAVYIYSRSPEGWSIIYNETGTPLSNMGTSIAILDSSGNIIAFGAPNHGNNQGMVRVLRRNSLGGWERVGEDIVGEPNDFMGSTLDGNMEYLAIGTVDSVRAYRATREGWIRVANEVSSISPIVSLSMTGRDLVVSQQHEFVSFWGLSGLGPPPTSAPTESPTAVVPTTSPAPTVISFSEGQQWFDSTGTYSTTPNTNYATSVSIDGSYAAIGAPGITNNGLPDAGGVFIHRKDGFRFGPPETLFESSLRRFGAAVDLVYAPVDGGRYGLLVGAPASTDISGAAVYGAARYFELVEGIWSPVGNIVRPPASDNALNSSFGLVVSCSSGSRRLAIGAPAYDASPSSQDSGRVFTYRYDGSTNTFVMFGGMLTGVSADNLFGTSVSLASNGERLLVGAPGDISGEGGSVYLYDLVSDIWRESFVVNDIGPTRGLGTSVAFLDEAGETFAVGAPRHLGNLGLIRIYQLSNGVWRALGDDIIGFPRQELGTTVGGTIAYVAGGTALGTFRTFSLRQGLWEEVTDEIFLPIPSGKTASGVVSLATSGKDLVVGRSSELANFYQLTRFIQL